MPTIIMLGSIEENPLLDVRRWGIQERLVVQVLSIRKYFFDGPGMPGLITVYFLGSFIIYACMDIAACQPILQAVASSAAQTFPLYPP